MEIVQKIQRTLIQRLKLNKVTGLIIAIIAEMGMLMACPVSVYAADFASACANLGLPENQCRLVIQLGKKRNLNDNAIAGILANMSYEAGDGWSQLQGHSGGCATVGDGKTYTFNDMPSAKNKHLNCGVGIIQWTSAYKLSDDAEAIINATGCGYIVVNCYSVAWEKHGGSKYDAPGTACDAAFDAHDFVQRTYTIPDLTGQVAYLMGGIGHQHNAATDSVVAALNSCSTAEEATSYFCLNIEKPRDKETKAAQRTQRAPQALAVVMAYDGKEYDPGDITIIQPPAEEEEEDDDLVGQDLDLELNTNYESLVESGIIAQDRLGAYYKLKEQNMNLDKLSREDFGGEYNEETGEIENPNAEEYSENLRQLSQWEANVEGEKITLVKILRWVCMFVGILMVLWVFLMYIAYWFDKINTIVPFSVLTIVSFGHYCVADNEESSDVNITNPEKTGKIKQINHKGLLIICLITLLFASFLLSGVLFNWMRYGIMWVQQQLTKLTLG